MCKEVTFLIISFHAPFWSDFMELENKTAKKTDAAVISVLLLFLQIFLQARFNIFFILFDALHILNGKETIIVFSIELKV